MFCAVLAWSRFRFVRFAADQRQATTLRLLAECFEELGGVPAVVLADRMGCLKGGVVANVVVPTAGLRALRRRTIGFRPDFCEAADPESKGVVEALVGYAKSDLVVPAGRSADVAAANDGSPGLVRRGERRVHSEIAAVPAQRLATERGCSGRCPRCGRRCGEVERRKVDQLRRSASARPATRSRELIGRRVEVTVEAARSRSRTDGEVAPPSAGRAGRGVDRRRPLRRPGAAPVRAIRPRSPAELAFLGLGPAAEAFLRAAAAAGTTRLGTELAADRRPRAAWGRTRCSARSSGRSPSGASAPLTCARSSTPGRVSATPPKACALAIDLPAVPVRPLAAYGSRRSGERRQRRPLAPDLVAGLRRLKLRPSGAFAPRGAADREDPALGARGAAADPASTPSSPRATTSNARARLRAAGFPVRKTLDEFEVAQCAVPRATFDYLASLEWIRARENLCLVGPAGTGKSHPLVALGHAAVEAGFESATSRPPTSSRRSTAASPTTRVGRLIDGLLRADLVIVDELGFAPLDDTGAQLLFRFVAAAYERRTWASPATGRSNPGAASCPSTPPPSRCSTGCCTTPSSSSPWASPTG